jgi:pullulanase/glycogen debranching enzyme
MFADRDGTVLDAPPLAHEIAADPVLADRRIVAAPTDTGLLARSGSRGFPHWAAWSERPAGFAADVVRFLAEGERIQYTTSMTQIPVDAVCAIKEM